MDEKKLTPAEIANLIPTGHQSATEIEGQWVSTKGYTGTIRGHAGSWWLCGKWSGGNFEPDGRVCPTTPIPA